jgi:hypothetical protein
MYDLPGTDSGREWIEVQNQGSTAVDLSQYKFSEASSNHALHIISGDATLGPGAYAIISDDGGKFMADWPAFGGSLFDSTFSLNNSSATLTLKDSSGGIVDQASYASDQGASGDGNSLQKKIDGTWISASPTPGAINASQSSEPESDPEGDSEVSTSTDSTREETQADISSHYSYVSISTYKVPDKFEVSAGRNRLGVVGAPIEFQAEGDESHPGANFIWTLGDGSVEEGERIEHAYKFPGKYAVVLDAKLNGDESISRTKVEVIEPDLSVEEANEKLVRIKNNSKEEINLYGFELVEGSSHFEFPKDTIILSGESVAFPAEITDLHPDLSSKVALRSLIALDPVSNVLPTEVRVDNSEEISMLMTKALEIQNEIAMLQSQTSIQGSAQNSTGIAVEQKPSEESSSSNHASENGNEINLSNTATVINSSGIENSDKNSSSTKSELKQQRSSWLKILEDFFFGQD